MEETSQPVAKVSFSERMKALLAEWGPLLVVVWFTLFGLVLVGFVLAIQLGFEVESTAGTLGTWGAAYVATQLTKPLRLAATVIITPALGAFLRRFRRGGAPAVDASAPESFASLSDDPSPGPAAATPSAALDDAPPQQR